MEQLLLIGALLISLAALAYISAKWMRAREDIVSISTQLVQQQQENAQFREAQLQSKEFEKEAITLQAKLNELQTRIEHYEKQKEESMKVAKAAMFDSGKEVFGQEAKSLKEQYEKITNTVAALHKQVSTHGERVETVWQTLSNPHSAGMASEVNLENTLKNYGLEATTDFVMQYHLSGDGGGLRPDAIVFLPGNNLLVIDSKASKFFLELQQASNEANEAELKQKLQKRMDEHLRTLATKGYKEATIAALKQKGVIEMGHTFVVMYMHNEAMIERLHSFHPQFRQKCADQDIILSGPSGLAGLLNMAKFEILKDKQAKNHKLMLEELSGFLGSVGVTLTHIARVGKGLDSAHSHFSKLVSSINSNLLPKGRRIESLGIDLPRSKQLPYKLSSNKTLSKEEFEQLTPEQKMLEDIFEE